MVLAKDRSIAIYLSCPHTWRDKNYLAFCASWLCGSDKYCRAEVEVISLSSFAHASVIADLYSMLISFKKKDLQHGHKLNDFWYLFSWS